MLQCMKRIALFTTALLWPQLVVAKGNPLDSAFRPNAGVCVRFDDHGHVVAAAVDGRADAMEANAAMLRLLQARSWETPPAAIVGKWIAMSVAPDGSPVPEILPDCSKLAASQ